ncbi:DUF7453 family protein [Stenomitos frigidus]|uniref:Exosortase n=1 Tax=Stenomitos frigidus ULC18 TaxID=2107698 RepID=A0A2T1DY69_9CYAN|nr:choice-of-anchor tandem repeat NxxGxxAF-containing protein [Stenomitos frigidus]PSB25432.1 hypothetical protein C7B82_23425 [Stenomitos frigidus ULC18]
MPIAIDTVQLGQEIEKAAYNFTSITNGFHVPYRAFRQATINNNGLVVFEAFFTAEAPPAAILAGDGVGLTTIADKPSTGADIVFIPSLNLDGVVSFTGNQFGPGIGAPPAASGIFTNSDGNFTTVADRSTSSGPFGNFLFLGGSDINDVKDVAFLGITNQSEVGIFIADGGEIVPIAVTSGEFDSFEKQINTVGGDGPITGVYPFLAFNNTGNVFFTASLDSGERGIFSSGEANEAIVDSKGVFDLFGSPSVNDNGAVAFLAQLDNHEAGIFTIDTNAILTTVATTEGPFSAFLSDPSISPDGKVAFQARLDDGSEGIFVGSDPRTGKVIGVGDVVAGSTVTQLFFTGREAFNGLGQIAFGATLANGTNGIFRADPISSGLSC